MVQNRVDMVVVVVDKVDLKAADVAQENLEEQLTRGARGNRWLLRELQQPSALLVSCFSR